MTVGTSIASNLLEVTDLPAEVTFERFCVILAKIAKSKLPFASKAKSGKYLTLERYILEEEGPIMSLSTPKPKFNKTNRLVNEALPLLEDQANQYAVIKNDWVPATQASKMYKAEPICLAGPLRPQWYLAKVRKLILKTVFSTRSTA